MSAGIVSNLADRLLRKTPRNEIVAALAIGLTLPGAAAVMAGAIGTVFFGWGILCASLGVGVIAAGWVAALCAQRMSGKSLLQEPVAAVMAAPENNAHKGLGKNIAPDFNPEAAVTLKNDVKKMRPLKFGGKPQQQRQLTP